MSEPSLRFDSTLDSDIPLCIKGFRKTDACQGRIEADTHPIVGADHIPWHMELPDNFHPRMTDPSLVFTIEGNGDIKDLRWGIRRMMARYTPYSVALFMTQSLNYNVLLDKRRNERAVLVTADSSPLADCIVHDLWARLLQHNSAITTRKAKYTVTIQGNVDATKVTVLSQHYFWLSSAFKQQADRNGDRHLLN